MSDFVRDTARRNMMYQQMRQRSDNENLQVIDKPPTKVDQAITDGFLTFCVVLLFFAIYKFFKANQND